VGPYFGHALAEQFATMDIAALHADIDVALDYVRKLSFKKTLSLLPHPGAGRSGDRHPGKILELFTV
jgi:hypothetical protein